MSLEFTNLDEFLANLSAVSNEYVGTAEKHLRRTGNRLKRQVKANTPEGEAPADGTKKSKHMKDRWKSEVKGISGNDLEYDLFSTAPHFHLVERGHAKVTPGGRVVGFVPGKHFFQKTVQQFQASGEVDKQLEKFMKDIKGRLEQ